jgi:hypothetical protein
MNVEIEAEAALFPEKEYINGIAVAVQVFGVHHRVKFIEQLFSILYCIFQLKLSPIN